jgi:uncharacterized membrane protein (DUF485 family)
VPSPILPLPPISLIVLLFFFLVAVGLVGYAIFRVLHYVRQKIIEHRHLSNDKTSFDHLLSVIGIASICATIAGFLIKVLGTYVSNATTNLGYTIFIGALLVALVSAALYVYPFGRNATIKSKLAERNTI